MDNQPEGHEGESEKARRIIICIDGRDALLGVVMFVLSAAVIFFLNGRWLPIVRPQVAAIDAGAPVFLPLGSAFSTLLWIISTVTAAAAIAVCFVGCRFAGGCLLFATHAALGYLTMYLLPLHLALYGMALNRFLRKLRKRAGKGNEDQPRFRDRDDTD